MAIIRDQNFNTFLKQNNFIIIKVLPDGHCLIYAVLQALYRHLNHYNDLTTSLANEIMNHLPEYRQFSTVDSDQLLNECQEYLFNKKWELDLVDLIPLIISKIIKHKIIVFQKINNNQFSETIQTYDEAYDNTIYLKLEGDHYEAIVVI